MMEKGIWDEPDKAKREAMLAEATNEELAWRLALAQAALLFDLTARELAEVLMDGIKGYSTYTRDELLAEARLAAGEEEE